VTDDTGMGRKAGTQGMGGTGEIGGEREPKKAIIDAEKSPALDALGQQHGDVLTPAEALAAGVPEGYPYVSGDGVRIAGPTDDLGEVVEPGQPVGSAAAAQERAHGTDARAEAEEFARHSLPPSGQRDAGAPGTIRGPGGLGDLELRRVPRWERLVPAGVAVAGCTLLLLRRRRS
jgi:hypothetical protein